VNTTTGTDIQKMRFTVKSKTFRKFCKDTLKSAAGQELCDILSKGHLLVFVIVAVRGLSVLPH
jgi:hypothetical protein